MGGEVSMSPDEPIVSLDEQPNQAALSSIKMASSITLLVGIWFFVSPWVYGAFTNITAWNSWLVGALIVVIAWIRIAFPASMPGLSWFSMLLGIYVFLSPWIYTYTGNTGRYINSLCVGFVVFCLTLYSATRTKRSVIQGPVTRQM